jgi:hypothetical protein
MKLRSFSTLLPVVVFALGCSSGQSSTPAGQASDPVSAPSVGSPGSHVGGHGMVLFGSEKLYLSHIPTYGTPHNIQVVVEAKVTSGVPEGAQSFGDKGYTLRPGSAWSLYDLAAGTLSSVKGTIYEGNFESGGRPKYPNVVFSITKVIYTQGLLTNLPRSATLDYVAVGTPTDAYLVHVLDEQRGFDQIVGVKLNEGALEADALSSGQFVSIKGGVNGVRTRLAVNADAEATLPEPEKASSVNHEGPHEGEPQPTTGDDAGTVRPQQPKAVTFKVRGEFSCLTGPDFFQKCPAVAPVAP